VIQRPGWRTGTARISSGRAVVVWVPVVDRRVV
jgi:hypothetical protein